MFKNTELCIILTVFFVLSECAPPFERQTRQGPFGGGGGFQGPMGGGMGAMRGPMSSAMGGPSMGGMGHNAGSMFSATGFQCIRHNIVCPKWCLVEDANGCKSCPCGPAGGMNAIAGGGPGSSPMGSPMSMGGMNSGSTGGGGVGGGGSVSGGGGAMPAGSGSQPSGGGEGGATTGSGSTLTGSSGCGSSSCTHTDTQTYVMEKPVKECAATLLCASTCGSGYTLGALSSGGCKACSCPSSHHVPTTTIQYIVQTVAPAKSECTHTQSCMASCESGYVMSTTDGYGCPECSCLQIARPEIVNQDTYQYPVDVAVEPQPFAELHFTCATPVCSSGCTVGYKCGNDGCPTCECIHPAVVGITGFHQVHVEKPSTCHSTMSCPSACSLGYKCGTDYCPTCECLVATTTYTEVRPQYTAQTCTHTLTCAATCTNGYDLFQDGSSSCQKCACRKVTYAVQRPQPQYQVIECPSTDSCASRCAHGYEVIEAEGRCPECKCKPAPVYYAVQTSDDCVTDCHETGSNVVYVNGGSSHQVTNTYTGGGGGDVSYVLGGGATSSGGFTGHGGSSGGGSNYVVASSGSGLVAYGASNCPALPPNCHPSCIKYDTPHCRRCTCETAFVRFAQG